jgi:hypothetical protein
MDTDNGDDDDEEESDESGLPDELREESEG